MKKVEFTFLLCGVGADLLYLSCNGLLKPGYVFLAVVLWLCASALHLAAHEMGHLLGGLVSGYKLVFFSIGSVVFSCGQNKKFSVSVGKSRGGQCVMEPGNAAACHYLCYNLGGVFANFLLASASGGLLLLGAHAASLLCINLVCVGMQKIILNSIPNMVNGVPNDAYVISLLSRNEDIRMDYCMYLKLYASYYREEKIEVQDYQYDRPLDAAENELLYYREIQSILAEIENAAAR